MHGGEATRRVEAKGLGQDEGDGRTGYQTTHEMNGRNRANNALMLGAVGTCGETVGRVPLHDVVGSDQRSPGIASPLGLAWDMFAGIGDAW